MVDTKQYTKPEFVNAKVLEEEGVLCVIIGEGGYHKGTAKDGQEYEKLYVDVEFPSRQRYKLKIGVATCDAMGAELKSKDTAKWVGTKLKLSAKENGGMKWVEPTIIPTVTEAVQ